MIDLSSETARYHTSSKRIASTPPCITSPLLESRYNLTSFPTSPERPRVETLLHIQHLSLSILPH